MDAASAQALSLRLLPRLFAFAHQKGWAAPRRPTPQELSEFQILVALLIVTARPNPSAESVTRDNIPRREPSIFATLRNLDKQIDNYENKELLDLAREQIPMERIRAEATALQQSDSPLACEEDALAHVLVQWFKHEYFKWADPIPCPRCGGKTGAAGMVPPPPMNKPAGQDESSCTDLTYLMRTRMGRCGEWANLYTLFLRAVGLRARYVWNKEDHVWNEYFSPAAGRWIHTDSCEAARDQPLLYDRGWGKKMSYVIAFSVDGASDVSRGMTAARRRNRSAHDLAQLQREDETERAWLAASDERAHQPDIEPATARESGTQEWKEARGEAGPGSGSA